jgi:hypothetical protein
VVFYGSEFPVALIADRLRLPVSRGGLHVAAFIPRTATHDAPEAQGTKPTVKYINECHDALRLPAQCVVVREASLTTPLATPAIISLLSPGN